MTDDARLDFAREFWDARNAAERRGVGSRRVGGETYDEADVPGRDDDA